LLQNYNYPGINRPGGQIQPAKQIEDLDQIGPADYSDYDLTKYVFYDKSTVQITGSRGCVRRCTFCDVYQKWPKYRWRSGQSIANEIIKLHQTHSVKNFFFTDSLINGNMKSFMEMCEILAEYRQSNDTEITWGGQFIVRKIKSLPADYFTLMGQSGAYNLTVGVESGSDRVREHIKKGFTNQDLDFHMQEFSRHNITCSFLMMIGYPTETKEDFEQTLDMLARYHKYVADGTIMGITLGGTVQLLQDVPLMQMYKDTLFNYPPEQEGQTGIINWTATAPNQNLTLAERIRRRLAADLVARPWGWNLASGDRELQFLLSAFENDNKTESNVTDFIASQG
jgi:hypothetical protein